MKRLTLLTILLATTPILSAQSGPLIGFAANAAGTASDIIRQELCIKPTIVCSNALPGPSTAYAGGAALSPMRSSVWHTQGTRLQELPMDNCQPICSMAAHLVLGQKSLASGLTINASRNEMYQVETIPGFAAVTTYSFNPTAPCPKFVKACRIMLPSNNHLAGAIAFDQRRDIIFVASSMFGAAAPSNTIFLFKRADTTCQPFCKIAVRSCLNGSLQSIRAMAYDECKEVIYISDGRQTSAQRVIWGSTNCPTLRPISCCPLGSPTGEFWCGFDVEASGPKSVGFSCTPKNSCPSCPNMSLEAVGLPTIGNGSFGLRIEQAPAGGTGFVIYNVGACGGLPFLCGRLYPQLVPAPAAIGGSPLAGVGPCGGSASFPLAIPNNFGLCGVTLCAQGLVLCPAGGLGLTNGQQIVIN